ncbi:predicted protein [Histoplasma mississippiense (nom. inval.)]|uniref:predicted protein n=1 Tax=Ajellomyces capsulatus (strain NAm1 / WU24) TaxID=2059318 RepID=UPI000157CC0C|nr:predicted protein [Histoplasma mississippiense (nom. inval.)]EDN09869.1 predicted protein [Histoplasma mississippiense (nom. inval.)]
MPVSKPTTLPARIVLHLALKGDAREMNPLATGLWAGIRGLAGIAGVTYNRFALGLFDVEAMLGLWLACLWRNSESFSKGLGGLKGKGAYLFPLGGRRTMGGVCLGKVTVVVSGVGLLLLQADLRVLATLQGHFTIMATGCFTVWTKE